MILRTCNPIGACLALLLALPAGAADLLMLDRVDCRSGVVRLADVAAILNAGPQEIDALGKIPLMPSPAPGQQQTVRAQSVRELLAAHGVDLGGLRFRGARETVVQSPVAATTREAAAAPTTLEPDAAEPAAEPREQTGFRGYTAPPAEPAAAYPRAPRRVQLSAQRRERLKEQLAADLTDYVQMETADGMLEVVGVELKPHNAATLAANRGELSISSTTALRVGRQRFVVSFSTTAGPVKFPVMADIVEARPAVIARRQTPRGAIITAADVYVAPLPSDYRPRGEESIATSLEDVIGKEAVSGLRPGEVVTDANCLPPVMVKRNSVAWATAGRGGIRVRTQVKVRRDGRLGDIVEVENVDSRELFEARVVGRNQLAVLTLGGAAAHALAQDIETLRLR